MCAEDQTSFSSSLSGVSGFTATVVITGFTVVTGITGFVQFLAVMFTLLETNVVPLFIETCSIK